MKLWKTKEGKEISYSEIEDYHLINILRMLKKYATRKWEIAYSMVMGFPIPYEELSKDCLDNIIDETIKITWRDYTHPSFQDLEIEANRRNLSYDLWFGGPAIDSHNESYIDLINRGQLERAIVGSIRDAIHKHGPITNENASSTAKRVIGAIKQWNKQNQRCKIKSN